MAYDPYSPTVTDSWSWEAQCALWRSRAQHQAERAAFYRGLAEAANNGTTVNPSAKEPSL